MSAEFAVSELAQARRPFFANSQSEAAKEIFLKWLRKNPQPQL